MDRTAIGIWKVARRDSTKCSAA